MSELREDAITRLSTVGLINLNTATPTILFVVPLGKSCVITNIVLRRPSGALVAAEFAFGWNDPSYNDIVPLSTHSSLTSDAEYKILYPITAAGKIGTEGKSLYIKPNTLQAVTITVDVFGYII